MSEPISPRQVKKANVSVLPDQVFDVFNQLISDNWDGRQSVVKQDAAASLIASALQITRSKVFELRYLDVENSYRSKGWSVVYDKPGYCEEGEAFFTFKPKTRSKE